MIPLQTVGCPACPAPAEIVDRFVLESTDGPIEHVSVRCSERHHFMMPTEGLRCGPPATRNAAPRRAPSG